MTMATTMTKVTTTTIKTTKTTTAAMMTTSMTLCISYSVTEYNYCLSPALSNSNSAANDTKRTHNSRRLKLQTLFISVQRQRTGGEDEQKSELRAHQVLFVVNRGILHCRHLDKSTGHSSHPQTAPPANNSNPHAKGGLRWLSAYHPAPLPPYPSLTRPSRSVTHPSPTPKSS